MEYTCSKCGHKMTEGKLSTYGGIVVTKKSGNLFKKTNSIISTFVCTNCGYIDFYVENPEMFK